MLDWRKKLPRRRYQQVILGLAIVLFVATVVLFTPSVQKKIVLSQAQDHTKSFAVEHLHILPWSVTVEGLQLSMDNIDLVAEHVNVSFCITKLFWRVLHIDELKVSSLAIKLQEGQSTQDNLNFPGLFAAINHGYRLAIEELTLDLILDLPDETSVALEIPNGALFADERGALAINVNLNSPTNNLSVSTSGELAITQSATGIIDEIAAQFEIALSVEQPPVNGEANELKNITLNLDSTFRPWLSEPQPQTSDSQSPRIIGDLISLGIKIPNAAVPGIDFSSDTTFEISKQRFGGQYKLAVSEPWVEQIIGNATAPAMSESGTGGFAFELGELGLTLDYQGDTKFTTLERLFKDNPVLPDYLRFHKSLSLESDLRQVMVRTLETGLTASDDSKLLTLALTDPIEFPIAEPFAAIADDKNIGRFDVQEIPMEWLGGFVPDATLRDGRLSGNFLLKTHQGSLQLIPEDDLAISATSIQARELPEQVVSLSMRPRATLSQDAFSANVDELRLLVGEEQAVAAGVQIDLPLTGEDSAMRLRANASALLDRIKNLVVLGDLPERYPTPNELSANVDLDVLIRPQSITFNQANLKLAQSDNELITAESLQTFTVPLKGEFTVDYQPGRLASIELQDIDLNWANPYLGELLINGELSGASFSLEHGENNSFAVIANKSMQISAFALAKDGDRIIENIFARLNPTISLQKDKLVFDYKATRINHGRAKLLSADGSATISRTPEGFDPTRVSLDGKLSAYLNELAGLPLASAIVDYEFGKTKWQVNLDYDIDYGDKQILLTDFDATVSANKKPRLTASSQGVVRIKPQIGKDEPLAQHATGKFEMAVKSLTAAEIADLVPLSGFEFDALDAQVLVSSDGSTLSAKFEQPISLSKAQLKTDDGPLINPFNLVLKGGLRTSGDNLDALLDEIRLSFVGNDNQPAVDGDMAFHIKPARTVPLEAMSANFRGNIPVILNQPAILPAHSLSGGVYQLSAQVHPNGEITGDAKFGELVAGEPLAVTEFSAKIDGNLADDGVGFNFSMPIVGQGKTGSSDGLLVALLDASKQDETDLVLDFSSETFYLNDLLAAIAAITSKTAATNGEKNAAPAKLTEEADTKAFWDLLPLDSTLSYEIKQLYYTDYVIFNDVGGTISIQPQIMELQQLTAYFHDSPMTFNGGLTFLPKTPAPYDVKLLGTVTDFNLSQFFSELVPGVKPRAEGLFGVSIKAFGTSPNMPQFRNNLFFDMRLQSRDGLFRPLPPDSSLMLGASDVLGVVGEGLSYMPTGGFGAGALSRLVNYIKEIDYDVIDMQITRGDSRDIIIEQFLVQSPTVRLTADGGIDYEYGKDVLDSPLTLDAQMNMSGKGAAILYSMALLDDEQDDHGYYHGPEFEIRGSANEPLSNFAEIISIGAKGTVAGGVTRPISGLIGNVKHRWFGDETKPAEANLELTGDGEVQAEDTEEATLEPVNE